MPTNDKYVDQVTAIMRDADKKFEDIGGSTRHYVRDLLLPMMEEQGLLIVDGSKIMEDKWISIKDALPEKRQEVLADTNTPAGVIQCIFVPYYSTESVEFNNVFIGIDKGLYTEPCVRNWMPLPEPPKNIIK